MTSPTTILEAWLKTEDSSSMLEALSSVSWLMADNKSGTSGSKY